MTTQQKLQQLRAKTYIFTVTDSENSEKPIIYAQLTTNKAINDQKEAEKLINDWFAMSNDNALDTGDFSDFADELTDLAYTMRKNGASWFNEQYCFELTQVNG